MNDKLKFKAFDDGGADELMRKSMEDFRVEPRPGLWRGISRKLLWNELFHFNFTNLSPKIWITVAVGLLLTATVLYVGNDAALPDLASPTSLPSSTQDVSSTVTQGIKPSAGLTDNSTRKSNQDEVVAKQTGFITTPGKAPKSTSIKENKQMIASAQASQGKIKSTSWTESVFVSDESDVPNLNASGEGEATTVPGITPVVPFEASLPGFSSGTDTIITITNVGGIAKFRIDKPAAGRFFSANLGITPELAFYAQPDAYSKLNVWLNGSATCHISRFSVGTGFGLGYVYDEGKYKVDYKSQDSIGYFYGVTSYTIGNNNEIIYQTQTVKVYDSLQHVADFRTKNRYSYLQLPLLFGYRFFETNKVSLTFQTGPAISLLLGSREADPVIEYSNATITRVDDETPVRIQTNWQVWANLYFEIRMNKQISIYLEPSFKYFLKPMVEQENVKFKAPWTIGLGIGLQFNFGQKKTNP